MEKPKSAEQKLLAILRLLDQRREIFQRQGAVRETWRTYRGRSVGPFYELRYRDGSKQRSIYLGRSADLAGQVRGRLQQLQAPRRDERRWRQACRRQRAIGRQLKANLGRELERLGLRLQGYEVRGMREACGAPVAKVEPLLPAVACPQARGAVTAGVRRPARIHDRSLRR